MAENVANELIFELLKRVHETQARHTEYHLETKERLGFLEQQYASISRRVDSMELRLDRIDKRLDIAETPVAGE